jgi:hypothetical protein
LGGGICTKLDNVEWKNEVKQTDFKDWYPDFERDYFEAMDIVSNGYRSA